MHDVALSGGAHMKVEEAGAGPAMMLLHAGVSERHMWDPQWEWLSHRMRVIRWDWRGFGQTAHVPGPFSYGDDVVRVMDALGISKTWLMGCSFGGSTAVQVALKHPDRVEGLVLVGSGVPGYNAANPPEVEALFAQADAAFNQGEIDRAMALTERLWLVGPKRRPEAVDAGYLARARELLARADRPDNGAVSQDLEFVAVGRLGEIRVPVLVVVGDADVPDIVSAAHYLADNCPEAELHVLHDAAHLPNLERPVAFNAILDDWLTKTVR
ncbi:alpha/beta fold hydrolase [Sulfobacillus harzensis]|nr:alpha/beta fold hydrolase [Sulfobacillus harzensis]